MEKRWRLLQADEEKANRLQSSLGISPVICKMLVQRGISSFDEARSYFRPSLDELHVPWLMKDMRKAVDRILAAINRQEKILVFGDYDVDGTTAVSLVFQFLKKIYSADLIDFYIPHRYREGYGVSRKGIDFAAENGFALIISLDCGIKSVDLVAYAKTLGIDFVICDHHLPDKELPAAIAILNPKQEDCIYPYKDLCGCGVGFKLVSALAGELNIPKEEYYCYLDLVATAIAADIVSMTGENRIMTYHGLKRVNEGPCSGIRALIELSGAKKPLTINNLVFILAPRVNAAGRMDDARKAVEMFIQQDYQLAKPLAAMLHSDNSDRREADSSITAEALSIINSNETLLKRKSTVVYQPHWHKGVVGIVASRLIEHYYRPTIVLTQSGDLIAGSARSVSGFNLYEAIHACRDHLLGYGGHYAAAGMTMLPDQLNNFIHKFEEVVSSMISPEQLIPEIIIDAEIEFRQINQTFFRILSQMEPFGPGNTKPVFLVRNVTDTGYSKVLKDEHLRFSVSQGNIVFSGIGFGMGQKYPLLASRSPVDIVFILDENEWNGSSHLQLKVIDFRPSQN